MSRDLSFWRTVNEPEVENKVIYAALSKGEFLSYVSEIPMKKIISDFNRIFVEWKNDNNTFYNKEDEAFELMVTKQFVRVDCYGMTTENLNKIIDLMDKYECPLYDSAIDTRFDGKE